MFKKLKLKIASSLVKSAERNETTKKSAKKSKFWARVWKIISAPFRFAARALRAFWRWLCRIDLVGLINLTLLLAIIVLFAILTMHFVSCKKAGQITITDRPYIAAPAPAPKAETIEIPAKATVDTKTLEATITLPLKKVIEKAKPEVQNAKPVSESKKLNFYGDMVIDGQLPGQKLTAGTTIEGNVYLQNMRRYTLPCGIVIDGDLFLRDVEMLRFCGDFTITGNIYVSRRSSFGPIPTTARLGGQVIF
ncbi:MAG: hypothetical protein LBJ18_01045 [Rickettsiales bacterium]|jgi:hypothetical protein|nr:hypothetical protein [Rickettsiales bacterium]